MGEALDHFLLQITLTDRQTNRTTYTHARACTPHPPSHTHFCLKYYQGSSTPLPRGIASYLLQIFTSVSL